MKENKICKQLLTNFLETWKMSENDLHDMTKRKQIFTNFWSLPVLSFCWPIGMWDFNWQWTRFAKFYWTRSSWIQRGWFEIIFDCMELSFVSHKAITNFQFLRTWTNTKFFCHDFLGWTRVNYFLISFFLSISSSLFILEIPGKRWVMLQSFHDFFFDEFFVMSSMFFGGKIGFNSVQDTFQFCHMWMTFKNKAMNYWGNKCSSLHFLTWDTWK